jgi:hypothetical protein
MPRVPAQHLFVWCTSGVEGVISLFLFSATPPPLTIFYIVVRAVCLEAVTRIAIINIRIFLLLADASIPSGYCKWCCEATHNG